MRTSTSLSMLAAIVLFVGCGHTGAMSDEVSTAGVMEQSAPVDAAVLRKGEIVFLRCRSCHSTEDGGPHLTGPNLHGLFGASAGTKSGYASSAALTASNIVWNADTLDDWLEQPGAYIPENMMVFAGLPKAEDRAAVIAYLAEKTR